MSESCRIEPNLPVENKQGGKPKPCCVCKDEKEQRDQCLLFYSQDSGKCEDFINRYKECMKGYGFTI